MTLTILSPLCSPQDPVVRSQPGMHASPRLASPIPFAREVTLAVHPSVQSLTAQRGRPPRRQWRKVTGVSAPLAPVRSGSCHDGVCRPDRRRVSARCVPGTTVRQDRLAAPDAQGRRPRSCLIIHGGVSNGRLRGTRACSIDRRFARRMTRHHDRAVRGAVAAGTAWISVGPSTQAAVGLAPATEVCAHRR
jgi:hypothetical protein